MIANWSGMHGELDQIKLVTVKITANGFTNSEIFLRNGASSDNAGTLRLLAAARKFVKRSVLAGSATKHPFATSQTPTPSSLKAFVLDASHAPNASRSMAMLLGTAMSGSSLPSISSET